jgi:hypothetical protein
MYTSVYVYTAALTKGGLARLGDDELKEGHHCATWRSLPHLGQYGSALLIAPVVQYVLPALTSFNNNGSGGGGGGTSRWRYKKVEVFIAAAAHTNLHGRRNSTRGTQWTWLHDCLYICGCGMQH